MSEKTVVVALGHKALGTTLPEQKLATRETAKAIADKEFRESWVIFQPHTYSRTKNLLDDFARALLSFDHVIVTDIYAAREQNIYDISSLDLVNKIKDYNKEALYMKDFDEIVSYIRANAKANDLVLTLGAGTVTNIGPEIIKP